MAGRSDTPERWRVYVLWSPTARRTYVGITTDAARRLAQHNGEARGGAKATRSGRPWRLAAVYGPYATRAEALRVERAVKRLRGRARLHARMAAAADGGRRRPR